MVDVFIFWQNDRLCEQQTASQVIADSESNEIHRFELLRNELMELEKRVQKSTDRCGYEEVHCDCLS